MSIHSRKKTPIPSISPPPMRDGREDEVVSPQNDLSQESLIRLSVDEQCLVHLDSALQLHRHQKKQQKISNSDRISFSDFSKISSKVENYSVVPMSSGDKDGDGDDDDGRSQKIPRDAPEMELSLWKLSKEERFWHDLYCVAVPTLYRTNNSASYGKVEVSSPQSKKRRRLAAIALELTPHVPAEPERSENRVNRVKELRRLVREAQSFGVPKVKSQTALRLLLALQREKMKTENNKQKSVGQNAPKTSDNSNNEKFRSVDSMLQQDAGLSRAIKNNSESSGLKTNEISSVPTTIDDRIRARAKERQRNLEQAKTAQKDPKDERVAIADALYSYACHVIRRRQSRSRSQTKYGRQRFASNTVNREVTSSPRFVSPNIDAKMQKSLPTKCIVTFKDVVQNGLPNRSRKEICRIFTDIVQVLSLPPNSGNKSSMSSSIAVRFLKWKCPKTGEVCGLPISKNAVVTIDTTNFKKVREILNRERSLDTVGTTRHKTN